MRFLPRALLFLVATGLSAASFRVALVGESSSWTERRPLVLALTDALVTFDPVTGFAKPGLASSWTVDPSGKIWTFTLRPARWSDGESLTSRDVVQAWTKAGVAAVSAPDPKVVKVVLPSPARGPAVFGAAPYLVFPDPVTGRSPGPFFVESQSSGRFPTLVLARNPAYRDAKAIKLTTLEFRFVPTLDDASALFRDGLVDWVPRGGGPGTTAPPDLRHTVVAPGWGLVFLRLNLHSPRLGDAAYRRALSESLDRTALAQGLRGPRLVPWASLVPGVVLPGLPALTKTQGPLPEPVLTLLYPQGETYRSIALEVADQWKRHHGLSVTVKAASYASIREARSSGSYELILSSWLGEWPDPAAFLGLLASRGPENDMGFSDPAIDEALGSLRSLPPGKLRDQAVSQALTQAAEGGAVIPLLSYAWVNQIDLRRWTGWSANPTDIHPWPGIGPKK